MFLHRPEQLYQVTLPLTIDSVTWLRIRLGYDSFGLDSEVDSRSSTSDSDLIRPQIWLGLDTGSVLIRIQLRLQARLRHATRVWLALRPDLDFGLRWSKNEKNFYSKAIWIFSLLWNDHCSSLQWLAPPTTVIDYDSSACTQKWIRPATLCGPWIVCFQILGCPTPR